MKKIYKKLILIILIGVGLLMIITEGILRGSLLIVLAVVGMFMVETRQVNRTLDYFDPLLFRCGRVNYVENGLILLKKSLLGYGLYRDRLAYIEVGLLNVKGNYQGALALSETFKDRYGSHDRLLEREVSYAKIKLGHPIDRVFDLSDCRDQLIRALVLVDSGKTQEAIQALLDLRGRESGNVIFREVNLLLFNLMIESHPKEADYYRQVAEMFDM
jgi:hypothetical protein